MSKRLLLIGPGALGRARAACFQRIPDVELVGVVSRTAASAERAAADLNIAAHGTDLDTVAEQARPDAAVIAVVNSEHHRAILWALEHDLDVFVEGPMVINSAQAREVVQLAAARRRIVEVGFQRRYHPLIQRARNLIHGGEIGPLIYGGLDFFWRAQVPGEPDRWYLNEAVSGGMPVSHLSYGLNTFRWVLGNSQRVFAAQNNLVFRPEQTAVDTLSVTMMYDGGAVAHIAASYSTPEDFPTGLMTAHCAGGGLALQILHGVHGSFWQGNRREEIVPQKRPEGDSEWGEDDLCAQCRAFARALETREALLNPPQDSLLELRLIESVLESARRHQAIEVEPEETDESNLDHSDADHGACGAGAAGAGPD